MKKIYFGLIAAISLALLTFSATAIEKYEALMPKKDKYIRATGFFDYPPFGAVQYPERKKHGEFYSIYKVPLQNFAKENSLFLSYATEEGTYEESIQKVRRGEVDLVLGMYHESKLYKGIEYIYPAAVSNPVTAMMMPDRVSEIATLKDFEKLKGAISSEEHFSDYVEEQLTRFNIQKEPNAYVLFEKLFTGEVDYVLGSHYYLLAETAKLGITDQVGIAKQTFWNMPLFIGVSKLSVWRKFLIYKLNAFMQNKTTISSFQNELAAYIKKIQDDNKGVVPPPYIRVQKEDDLTASQQAEKENKTSEEAKGGEGEEAQEQPAKDEKASAE